MALAVTRLLLPVYVKGSVQNQAAAVAIAVGEGWIEPPERYGGTKGKPLIFWRDKEKSGISPMTERRRCGRLEVRSRPGFFHTKIVTISSQTLMVMADDAPPIPLVTTNVVSKDLLAHTA